MGMGFAPTWHRQVNPLLHKTTLTTVCVNFDRELFFLHWIRLSIQLDPERCMGGSRPNENDCVFITTKMHRNSNYTQRISTISVGNVCVGIGLWCCEKFEKVLLWESIIVPSKKKLCACWRIEKNSLNPAVPLFFKSDQKWGDSPENLIFGVEIEENLVIGIQVRGRRSALNSSHTQPLRSEDGEVTRHDILM